MLAIRPSIFIPSRQRGYYIRTITARAQLKKKKFVSLKELDAKTN
jgi:hypothetical protein